MEEKDHPTTPDPQTPSVWCPGCLRNVPLDDRGLEVSFTPIHAEISPTGAVDLGADVFLDYQHWECGAKVRISDHAIWDEEAHEYIKGMTGWLEIYINGEYQPPPEYSTLVAFSGDVAEDTRLWGPTLVALREAYERAAELLHEMIGDESA
jgi:hypothetical protein